MPRYGSEDLEAARALIAAEGWQTIAQVEWFMSEDAGQKDVCVAMAAADLIHETPTGLRQAKNEAAVVEFVARILRLAQEYRE